MLQLLTLDYLDLPVLQHAVWGIKPLPAFLHPALCCAISSTWCSALTGPELAVVFTSELKLNLTIIVVCVPNARHWQYVLR